MHLEKECPFRDDIRDLKAQLPEIKKIIEKTHNRLFIDNNEMCSLISEVRKNTNYRKKTEDIVLIELRNRWNKYGFTIAIIVLVLSTIWNIINILIVK